MAAGCEQDESTTVGCFLLAPRCVFPLRASPIVEPHRLLVVGIDQVAVRSCSILARALQPRQMGA